MPYNSELDESLYSKSFEVETGRLTVSVYSYNKGMKKMQLSRESRTADGDFRFGKLGRVTKEEAEQMIPLMQEALKSMD